MSDDEQIRAVGIVSRTSGKGLVDLSWGSKHGLLDAHEMSNHVQMLLREAWWADADAALAAFCQEVMSMQPEAAAVFVADVRRHRYARLDQAAHEQAVTMRAAYEAEIRDRFKDRKGSS